jgi:hypothetical protein
VLGDIKDYPKAIVIGESGEPEHHETETLRRRGRYVQGNPVTHLAARCSQFSFDQNSDFERLVRWGASGEDALDAYREMVQARIVSVALVPHINHK